MSAYRFPLDIRQVIIDALPEETALYGEVPTLQYTYLPAGHAKALNPDNMLVVGIRGAGKSYWWSALQEESLRLLVGKTLSSSRITKDMHVSPGFGEKSSPDDYPGKDVLRNLLTQFDARDIWRTVVFTHLARQGKKDSLLLKMEKWIDRVKWVYENPEDAERLALDADIEYERSGTYHLILFDALDRTADDWTSMYKLVKGLLQVLLEFRSSRRIRLKAFVRPDHLEDSSVIAFPDSSKILSQKVELNWPVNELYGLLWQHLANEEKNGELFRSGYREGFNIEWTQQNDVWIVPEELRNVEEKQKEVFHAITGNSMGKDSRRGVPYTWLPNHLGDARRQVSPRSFLAALRHGASNNPKPEYPYALYYENIKKGVQEASKIRVREMQEDYPWVETLMKPLAGLSVPCKFEDINEKWSQDKSLDRLRHDIGGVGVKLPPARLDSGPTGVREDLEALGLFEQLLDGRVNLPDVYRVGYRIGRRGGIKPVARG